MDAERALRDQLVALLDWKGAHADFDTAVGQMPAALRGARPDGVPYSPWQLIEHMRRTQRDILDFCTDPEYVEPAWPDDYWPETAEPPDGGAWDDAVRAFGEDLDAMKRLAADPGTDLFARIPHGDGQTYLREVVLAADHNAYHIGQLVLVRRLLGTWPAA